MPWEEFAERGRIAMGRAIEMARPTGVVTTAHLLLAVTEGDGPLVQALARDGRLSFREVVDLGRSSSEPDGGVSFDLLARQAISSAGSWAEQRGERANPEHLFIVLVDQGSAPVADALARSGVDAGALRRLALETVGAPVDHEPVPLVSLPPAGTIDRPPLPLGELPLDVWQALQRRQEHLPLRRLRRPSDWDAISLNEQRAVLRLGRHHQLDDDQSYSLLHHHLQGVQWRAAAAAPTAVPEPPSAEAGHGSVVGTALIVGRRDRRLRHLVPRGWVVWFGNRRVGLRAAWLRLSVRH
jgi:ClpA/ClpB-like protein